MSVELISTNYRTARKSHACWICGPGAIQVGQQYTANTNVYDGRIYTLKFCNLCEAVSTDVWQWALYIEDGVGPDTYAEWAYEYADTDPRAKFLVGRLERNQS